VIGAQPNDSHGGVLKLLSEDLQLRRTIAGVRIQKPFR